MKLFTCVCLFLALINYHLGSAQALAKRGGVCFRIDDNQDPLKMLALDSVFRKNNARFVYAPNSQKGNFNQPANFWPTIKLLQERGHEIADHSPNHYPHFFELNGADTTRFKNRAGIDHIKFVNEYPILGSRICLKYNIINPNGIGDEGLVDIKGNLLISKDNGAFANNKIYGITYITQFYFPTLNLLCSYVPNIRNANVNDPDTIELLSFWNENENFGNHSSIPYKKLSNYDIGIDKEGFKVMQQFSFDIFKKNGIAAPKTWIQPGGAHPYLSKSFIADVCGSTYHFKSAATYPGARKGFNEIDKENENKFHLQWGDFFEETQSVSAIKNIIADRQAKHRLSFGLNHLSAFGGAPFETILANLDSLLQWCNQKGIPIKTYSEWGAILYDSIPNPTQNIFPLLSTDLNEDNIPDGMLVDIADIDNTQGAGITPNKSIKITQSKQVFGVAGLNGIEKGKNIFKLYTKGTVGSNNSVSIYIDYPEISKFEQYSVRCSTSSFQLNSLEYNIPEGVSYVNIYSYAYIETGELLVSGMEFLGAAKPKFKTITLKRSNNQSFETINLHQYVYDNTFEAANLSYSVLNGGNFNATISNNKFLSIEHKLNPFWLGKDSLQLLISNPSNLSDTAWIYLQSSANNICKGGAVQITYPFNSTTESSITWSAVPTDTSLNTNIATPVVKPNTTTVYTASVTDKNNNVKKYTITLTVTPSTVINKPNIFETFNTNNTITLDIGLPYFSNAFIGNTPKRTSTINNGVLNIEKGVSIGNDTTLVVIQNQSCEVITQQIITSTSTIVQEMHKNAWKIYPNPVQQVLYVEHLPNFQSETSQVQIFDLMGKELKQFIITKNQTALDLSWLGEGIYIVKINVGESHKESFKIVKN